MVSVTSSSSASNNLDISCPTCHSLQPPTLIPQGTSPAVHFIPASELKTSSTSCDECRLIWDALGLYKHEWGEKEMELSVEVRMVSGGPLKVIWRNDILYLELFDRQGRFPTIGPVVEIPVHSSDEECYNTAAKWLENCVENHTLCKSTSSDPYLPTRVLDIGLDSSRDPFLFETNGQPGKYVALSYCWGKTKVLTTTTKNISSHKRSIPLDTLPKTLQDAVIISRRLGIPYLWVDALCIIQDDGDDWAYEASKMCDVYSLAHLTIAASNSPGSDKGIFSTQKYGIAPQPLRYQDRTIYVRPNLARQHDRSSALMQIPDAADPIVFRAWCLQEAVLANRILRYTSNELTWECNEQYACECGGGTTIIETDDVYSLREFRRPELSRVMSPSITAQHPYRKWNELIMVFTERHLTKDTDKLPALAGLARQFHMATEAITGTKDKYLAGLWRSDLGRALLWQTESDFMLRTRDIEKYNRRPSSWRAPSWSWAAVERPVHMDPLEKFTFKLEVLESVTELGGIDPFGHVKDGWLKVIGTAVHGLKIESEEANPENKTRESTDGIVYTICTDKGEHRLVFICDDPGYVTERGNVYSCLHIGSIDWWRPEEEEPLVMVLRRMPGEKDAFQRVGVVYRSHETKNHVAGRELLSLGGRETLVLK